MRSACHPASAGALPAPPSRKVVSAARALLDDAARRLRGHAGARRLSTENHLAGLINRKGRAVAVAWNKAMTPSKGCGASAHTMHAEIAVIKKLGDLRRLAGCTLVLVARFTPGYALAASEPCASAG